MREVAIYALADRQGNVRYVGKTACGLKNRLRGHRTDAVKGHTPLHKWIRDQNFKVDIVLLETVTEAFDWPEREQAWIRLFRSEPGGLLNLASGGQGAHGYVKTPEHIEKIANAQRRRVPCVCAWCGKTHHKTKTQVARAKRTFCCRECADLGQIGKTGSNPKFPPQAIEAARQKRLAITHCPQGHPYSGDNLYVQGGRRRCRTCLAAAAARYRSKKKAPQP